MFIMTNSKLLFIVTSWLIPLLLMCNHWLQSVKGEPPLLPPPPPYPPHLDSYQLSYPPLNDGYKTNYGYKTTPISSYNNPEDHIYVTDSYGKTTTTSLATFRAMTYVSSCSEHTCGYNAQCSIIGGRPVCSCFRGYLGDPLVTCRRAECLDNTECRNHQTCRNGRCIDVCDNVCGTNAQCRPTRHIPVCSCPAGYTGDPFTHCRHFDPAELCHPSPCGPNTECEVLNGVPTCRCRIGYHGQALTTGCRHECESDAECAYNQACVQFKCQNPCAQLCGAQADCETIGPHRVTCKCPKGYIGNPYAGCRPECYGDTDCPTGRPACFYGICKNPCEGVCGTHADCHLKALTPVCSCAKGMTGDPFVACRPFEKRDLCEPNPCGSNARCEPGHDRAGNDRPVCTCHPGYVGDPLKGCLQGECTLDSHCAGTRACIDYKCQNPCIGQCGVNAMCQPRNHIAVCTCINGYNGDALTQCRPIN